MLPLGLRVQSKIEALVNKHMQSVGASKVSLSSISSQKLWAQSGRLDKGSEFFKFRDRKGAQWLLAPTHEEEITTLVKEVVHAPSDLPIRLYQISRKYRDEKRPRGGLLRGREFIMKDLYTFDATEVDAHNTYSQVRQAYNNLFSELNLPYIEARADSGNMGGSLSHEFHFPSNIGEDDIITCSECDFAKNEEFVPPFETKIKALDLESLDHHDSNGEQDMHPEIFISKDKRTIVKAFVSAEDVTSPLVNPFVVKKCLEDHTDIDTGVEDPKASFMTSLQTETGLEPTNFQAQGPARVYYLFDQFVDQQARDEIQKDLPWLRQNSLQAFEAIIFDPEVQHSHLQKKRNRDPCPTCLSSGRNGILTVQKAIEVGHTFHLGERYSSKMDLQVPGGKQNSGGEMSYVSMGCHGIGVSRLIAAVASALSDSKGLIWPRVVAPFEVLIIVNTKNEEWKDTVEKGNWLYDKLSSHTKGPTDVLIDDRAEVDYGWKLKDADLIGYPVVVVLGKGWMKNKLVEIQCRRLKLKEQISLDEALGRIQEILAQL